jgi:phosphate transport system substrate-binding protein
MRAQPIQKPGCPADIHLRMGATLRSRRWRLPMKTGFISRAASAACRGAMLLCTAGLLATTTPAAAQALRVGGTGSALGTARLLGDALAKQDSSVAALNIVPNLGSGGALRALQAGAIDVALISRALKAEETAAGLVGYEYGRSPFVLVTDKTNVKNITATAVADMLSGRNATWPDGQPVRVVMRPETDGDNGYLAGMSPLMADALKLAHKRPGMVVAATDQDAATEAERLPGSLAASTLALLLSEQRKLTVLAFEGATPSAKALASGGYPYFKPMVLVTRGAPAGAALRLVEFTKSAPGRALLEANGHALPN